MAAGVEASEPSVRPEAALLSSESSGSTAPSPSLSQASGTGGSVGPTAGTAAPAVAAGEPTVRTQPLADSERPEYPRVTSGDQPISSQPLGPAASGGSSSAAIDEGSNSTRPKTAVVAAVATGMGFSGARGPRPAAPRPVAPSPAEHTGAGGGDGAGRPEIHGSAPCLPGMVAPVVPAPVVDTAVGFAAGFLGLMLSLAAVGSGPASREAPPTGEKALLRGLADSSGEGRREGGGGKGSAEVGVQGLGRKEVDGLLFPGGGAGAGPGVLIGKEKGVKQGSLGTAAAIEKKNLEDSLHCPIT